MFLCQAENPIGHKLDDEYADEEPWNHRVIAATQFHENTNQQLQRVHGIRFACDQAVQPFEEDYEETERQAGDNERADLMPEEWSERMIFPSGKHITRKEIEHWDMEGIERSPHWFRAYGMPPEHQ